MVRKGKPHPALMGDLCFIPGLFLLGNDRRSWRDGGPGAELLGEREQSTSAMLQRYKPKETRARLERRSRESHPIFCEASV